MVGRALHQPGRQRPGPVYQYPTTIEGVNLYQNSVALTQPMYLQDTKRLRTPYLPYGQILNIGELSGSPAFLDSPGHSLPPAGRGSGARADRGAGARPRHPGAGHDVLPVTLPPDSVT
ncbi:hypothetical protein [Plantactinospora sp. KLBMP9567]|uniref:hypothetical protein n=1 Tax=Plantactinospora sp. KLBMP9567 TaxID=3085900 RepID=UPI002982577B|nr:hypothetical protein [Plantactinospora sp. KLBMP9567]MDW5326686.1 hypothetical protein [Plantactinospora sp. KLBMP9567]